MTTSDPPPLTIVQPGEGSSGTLGSIGVDFKLWGTDTGRAVSIVEHPFPVGASCDRTYTREKTSTPSSPRERLASDLATAKLSFRPADTSRSRATSCTPCGTPATFPPA